MQKQQTALLKMQLDFDMNPPAIIRPCSVYSMVDESSDEPKLFPTRKKNLRFKHFFIFSSDILKSWEVFLIKSVGFLLKYRQNLLNIN